MAYGKRAYGNSQPVQKGRKVQRFQKRRSGPAIVRQPSMPALDGCWIKSVRLVHISPSSATNQSVFGVMQFQELKDNAKFNRFASLYGYFRVHSMKITVNAQGHVATMQSYYDPDDHTVRTFQTQISANHNSRLHQLSPNKTSSRIQKLGGISKYQEFLDCRGAQTTLQEEKYKSGLHYCFTGLPTGGHYNITVAEEYVVQFKRLRDKFSTDTINPGAMNNITAVGPEDTPMYFDSTTNP